MYDENAGHAGNHKTSHGLIIGAGAPKPGQTQPGVAGSTAPGGSFLKGGTADIAIMLKNGATVCFPGTYEGIEQSNKYADEHRSQLYTAHFGTRCWYFRDGHGVACVEMTRAEFFAMVVPS